MSLHQMCDPKEVEGVRVSLRAAIRPLSILVIDDDQNECELCGFTIESIGAKPLCAATAEDALKTVKGRCVDLILLDLNLPRGDSAELFRDLKQKTPHIPVVVITGMPGDRHPLLGRVRDAGATLVYEKPLTQDDLLALTRANA